MRATLALNGLTLSFHSENLIELMVPVNKMLGFYSTKNRIKALAALDIKMLKESYFK